MATDMKITNQIDLRDVPCMPLDVNRLLNSDTWLAAADQPVIAFALMNLWMRSWHQVPAGSLPAEDSILARLAMCDKDVWSEIKTAALAGWTLGDDGRFYHAVIVEKAAECDEQRAKKAAFAELQRAKGLASAASRASAKKASAKAKTTKSLPATMEKEVDPRQMDVFFDAPATAQIEAKKVDAAELVFEHYKQVMNSPRSKLDPKRRRLIASWIKHGYTAEDLKLAIDGCRASVFHMGDNKNKMLYNSIELILRDAKHIDDFIKSATGAVNQFLGAESKLSDAGKQSMSALQSVFMKRPAPAAPAAAAKEIGHE
jgi:hypothetical protein